MSKKVLWNAQVPPLSSQLQALEQIHGHVALFQMHEPNAERLARIYRNGGYDDLVVIAPAATLQRICEQGLRPLWPEVRPSQSGETSDFWLRKQGQKFVGFRRLVSVGLDLRDPGRLAGDRVLWLSQHRPWPEMLEELDQLAGRRVRIRQQDISQMSGGFVTPAQVADLFRQSGADEMILVAPYPVFEGLTQMGINPLYAEMSGYGRDLHFVRFWRVHGLRWQFTQP